jgi:hypothetical protein
MLDRVNRLFHFVGWDKPTHELAGLFISASTATISGRRVFNQILRGYVLQLREFQHRLEGERDNRHREIIPICRKLLQVLERLCETRQTE